MALWKNALIRRTFALMLLGIVMLLVLVSMSLWLAERIHEESASITYERQVRNLSGNILSLLNEAESSQRGYLLTQDRSYLEPYESAILIAQNNLRQLKTLTIGQPETTARVNRLAGLADEKIAELAETVRLASTGQQKDALALVHSDLGRVQMDQMKVVLDDLITRSGRRVVSGLQEMQSAATALAWVTVTGALLIVLLAAGGATVVARHTGALARARTEIEMINASLEERVRDRTADLTRANEEIQRFAYIVSHDLRAPLVNIVGFTSELETSALALQRYVAESRDHPASPELAKEAETAANLDLPESLGFIRASTAKMDRLISAILKLSREGRRELRPERVDLAALFKAAAASLQHQLADGHAGFDVVEPMPVIVSDRLALEQIFGNLIDNAVKYLSPDRPGHIRVTSSEQRGLVTIDVIDNGRGIAPNDHVRIFELFRRAGPQDHAGEGIGLAHVQAMVRRLGGTISVESELGRGSRFTVTLPKFLNPPESAS